VQILRKGEEERDRRVIPSFGRRSLTSRRETFAAKKASRNLFYGQTNVAHRERKYVVRFKVIVWGAFTGTDKTSHLFYSFPKIKTEMEFPCEIPLLIIVLIFKAHGTLVFDFLFGLRCSFDSIFLNHKVLW